MQATAVLVQIGVVEAIAAPSMIRVEFTGKGGHGGGMPMKQRCADAESSTVSQCHHHAPCRNGGYAIV